MLYFMILKAFEKAWSQGSIFKTRKSGVYGVTFEQIKNFSSKDINVLKLMELYRNLKKCTMVPQGAVILPLLFLISINDLVQIVLSYLSN